MIVSGLQTLPLFWHRLRGLCICWGLFVGWMLLAGNPIQAAPVLIAEEVRGTEPAQKTVARFWVDRLETRLSGEVILTLEVEGPAPLDVRLQKSLLAPESAQVWQVREPVGNPGIPSQKLPQDRELWKREFHLRPFIAANQVPIQLTPWTVRAGGGVEQIIQLEKAALVQVTTTVPPKIEALRERDELEAVPQAPDVLPDSATPYLVVSISLTLVVLGGGVYFWRRGKSVPKVQNHDEVWAVRALDTMIHWVGMDYRVPAMLTVLRSYLQYRLGESVLPKTTPELLPLLPNHFSLEASTELQSLLEWMDRAQFSGGEPPVAQELPIMQERLQKWLQSRQVEATNRNSHIR